MEHKNSITIHRDESGHAQIWILDYQDAKQIGETRELPVDHPAHAAILSALDADYQPAAQRTDLDAAALAIQIAMRLGWNREVDGGSSFDAAVTAIKHEIESALAGPEGNQAPAAKYSIDISGLNDKRPSNEAPGSAAVSTEDVLDTQPLTVSE